jgi:hypothetical protein
MGVLVEQLVGQALREHLLLNLTAKVAEVNALRAAVLLATVAGPYTVPASAKLYISIAADQAPVTVSLTAGSRTTAQLVTEINTAMGSTVASADAASRLALTGTAPSSATSVVSAQGGTNTANSLFGWDEGGEVVVRAQLVAPGYRGVADGWPLLNDLGGGFWVIIGDRESVPVQPDTRKDEHLVALEVAIFCPVTNEQSHRDREAIQSCVRCVRELVLTDAGRQLGRAAYGDIVKVEEKAAKIPGRPWKFKGNDAPNALFDVAALQLNVRVFERPASTS